MPDRSTGGETAAAIAELLELGVRRLLGGCDTPELDAEVLLCHCLAKDRSFLRAWPERRPAAEQTAHFLELVERRRQGEPVAYLTGSREFWSREFLVSPEVLIPRPDSELLIELGLERLPANRLCKVIELGTGSGILAITLAAERPLADVLACDISAAALDLARLNAERLKVANVRFRLSHWFDAIADAGFDLIVSNPPYIAEDDPHLQQGDLRFEPRHALVSAGQGLRDIAAIAEQSRQRLTSGGHLLIEHGYNQQAPVQAIFAAHGYRQIATHADLSGNPRVTSGLWSTA